MRRFLSQEPGWQGEAKGHGAPFVVQAPASPILVHQNVITAFMFFLLDPLLLVFCLSRLLTFFNIRAWQHIKAHLGDHPWHEGGANQHVEGVE